ncbi:I78 family peptidase inhibitor [Pseudomonas sp. Irchel 3E20]|uniref:I78 family peptidase inhibitor n=1 Tax=Pseudomonas sp. Irchel 3E20 TaxID=2008983 RepID=UPI000BA4DA52|nr:I78 family peptidase inhibitor [Pseudomonas sp. Irchel 3E20]
MPCKLVSFATLSAVLALSGCSTAESVSEPATDEMAHARCESKAADFVIGKKATPELLEQARKRSGAHNARVLRPDDVMTLEYRSDRLNLNTDDNLVITRVNCG